MSEEKTHLAAKIPVPEATALVAQAVKNGVELAEFIGYHVLKSAFGSLHPVVAKFEESHRGTTQQ